MAHELVDLVAPAARREARERRTKRASPGRNQGSLSVSTKTLRRESLLCPVSPGEASAAGVV